MGKRNQLLLIEDVDDLGRSGDMVSVQPGFARNFLLPQKKAIVATKGALQFQEKLRQERAKKAAVDKEESEKLATRLNGKEYKILVKVDPDGHMYGSVSAQDIMKLLKNEEQIDLEKKAVQLTHPIKTVGKQTLQLRLKEGVMIQIIVNIESDTPLANKAISSEEHPKEGEIQEES